MLAASLAHDQAKSMSYARLGFHRFPTASGKGVVQPEGVTRLRQVRAAAVMGSGSRPVPVRISLV
jgi:hypothetical protein